MAKETTIYVGKSKVPLRSKQPANTISVGEALQDMQAEFAKRGDHSVDPISIQVGVELQRARKRKGVTQKQLAAMTGIPQGRISEIEAGKGSNGPTLEIVNRLASTVGLKIGLSEVHRDPEDDLASCMEKITNAKLADASHDLPMAWVLVGNVCGIENRKLAIAEARASLVEQQGRGTAICRPAWGVWNTTSGSECRIKAKMPTIVAAISENGVVRRSSSPSVPSSDRIAYVAPGDEVTVSNNGVEVFGFITLTFDETSTPDFDKLEPVS